MHSPLELEFAQRTALTTPEDTVRGMFFSGLLRVVKSELGEDAAARCHAVTGERRFVDVFSYSAEAFMRMTQEAMRLLVERKGSPDAALRHLGREAASDFFASAPGRMLLTLAGRDPRKAMSSLPTAYRTTVSYGERRMVWEGATTGRLEVRRDFLPPPYLEGILTAALEVFGAQDIEVRAERKGPLDTDYVLRWGSVAQ